MIVDPDFLDHWRTRMVVDALKDETVPMCILRLWAHCQTRKADRFEIPTPGLKAQCRFQGDAQQFEAALIDAGFIARDGSSVHVLGWAEQNASLLAAWENGAKGGRPKKPTGNPMVTHGEPSANPDETDKSREEKKRTTPPQPPSRGEPETGGGFARFWASWPKHPRKAARHQCWAKWRAKGLEEIAERIVAHVEAMKRSEGWTKQGGEFIPAPLVYLNQGRWEAPVTSSAQTENHQAEETKRYLQEQAEHKRAAPPRELLERLGKTVKVMQ